MRRTTENRTEKPWAARTSHPSTTAQGLSFASLAGSRNPKPFDEENTMTKQDAIREATAKEQATLRPHYVVRDKTQPGEAYSVWDWMPMMGEWYSSDGIQHGS